MIDKEKVSIRNKLYRINNKEKIKSLQDNYYLNHRLDRIKNASNWRLNNPEHYKKTRRAYMLTPKGRLTSVKSSAKTRKIDYNLIDDDAINILSSPCYYCNNNIPVGIDRLDSSIGYSKDNCVACCSLCNYMKQDYTEEEFVKQCKLIAKHHS